MADLPETLVLYGFVMAIVWLYGGLLRSRLKKADPLLRARVVRRFRFGGTLLATLCFGIGLLYRLHVVSFTVAGVLYIPELIGFMAGMRFLQPYLRWNEGDSQHE